MPSEAQISANRRNAQRSTGPRTEAGRARSAMNATKSGIYAKSQIIPGEDPAELEDLKSRIYGSLQPSDEEGPLVDQLIDADWQLRRLRRAEAELWTMSITGDRKKNREKGRPEDQEVHFRAIEDNKDTFDRIYRLQASTARLLNRSLETLLRLRKAGLTFCQNEPDSDPAAPVVASTEDLKPAETNPIPDPVSPEVSSASDPISDETNRIPEPAPASPQPLAPSPRAEGAPPAPDSRPPAHRKGFPYGNSRYRYHPKR